MGVSSQTKLVSLPTKSGSSLRKKNFMAKPVWSALLDPSSVVINRESRQRRELTGIDELMSSIVQRGQIQPIVVQRGTNVLIAGERRITAIRRIIKEVAGMSQLQVKVVYSDEVDPAELKALEYEENSKRIDLSWQDNCLAIWDYHNLRATTAPDWSQAKTAEALGISPTTASERLLVAAEIRGGNKMVAEAPKFSTAKGIVQRASERREAAETSQLVALVSRPIATAPSNPTKDIPKSELPPAPTGATGHILNLDFNTWAQAYDGPKFNLIHCDFPYGVGMHKSDQGSGDSYGTYEDTPDVYFQLLETLMANLDNFCEDSAHLMFWFSMDYYQTTKDILEGRRRMEGVPPYTNPWVVNPFPLVWHKSDGSGIIPDANRGPRRTYETAFLASRGDRKIVRAVTNSVASPIQRGRHMSEKPQAVLQHYFRMLVDEHSSVLDPTCGSGSAIRAAYTSGASRYLGLELNSEFADHADEVLREHMAADSIDVTELMS